MISTLIGVGFMGKGIAKNLALKGLSQSQGPPPISQLHLYDTNAVQVGTFLQSVQDDIQPEIKAQIQVLNDPTAVLGQSGFVALSLPSESVCDRLLFDKSDGIISKFASDQSSLSPGRRFIVDHGTYSRDFVLYCHERIKKTVRADLGATCAYIDAPVSGGPQGAWNGTLSIMMGGDKECIDCILPILKLYSTRCVHFGPVGSGMAVKLVNQALVGMHAQAACEAIRLAESFGLVDAGLSADQSANFANARNVQLLKELLLNSWGQSKVLELVVSDYEQIINGAKSAGSVADALASAKSAAPLRNMDKDFDCISRDLSKALNSTQKASASSGLPVFEQARAAISTACKEKNMADAPFASLIKLLKDS